MRIDMLTRSLTMVAALALASGCVGLARSPDRQTGYYTAKSVSVAVDSGGGVDGGAIEGSLGGPLRIFAAALVTRLPHADGHIYTGLGATLGLRGTLFGFLADTHELERYFDIGAEAGFGGDLAKPPDGITGLGSGWLGVWLEFGLPWRGESYPSLLVGYRHITHDDPWRAEDSLFLSLAWVHRGPEPERQFHD